MEKFLNYLLGTNDYALVGAGFVLSLFVAIYPMIKSGEYSLKNIILKILSIACFMRFYPFVMSFIGLSISLEDTMVASLISGFFSQKIIDKFQKEGNEQIDEL